jgi:hypothetical protein
MPIRPSINANPHHCPRTNQPLRLCRQPAGFRCPAHSPAHHLPCCPPNLGGSGYRNNRRCCIAVVADNTAAAVGNRQLGVAGNNSLPGVGDNNCSLVAASNRPIHFGYSADIPYNTALSAAIGGLSKDPRVEIVQEMHVYNSKGQCCH